VGGAGSPLGGRLMSEAPEREYDRRWRRSAGTLRPDLERVEQWGTRHPDRYAGLWYDGAAFDVGTGPVRLVLAVTDDPDRVRPELGPLRHPDRVEVVRRDHTSRDLARLAHRVAAEWTHGAPGDEAARVTAVAPDEQVSRVRVVLSRRGAGLAARLVERYGSAWLVVDDEPAGVRPMSGRAEDRTDDPPPEVRPPAR